MKIFKYISSGISNNSINTKSNMLWSRHGISFGQQVPDDSFQKTEDDVVWKIPTFKYPPNAAWEKEEEEAEKTAIENYAKKHNRKNVDKELLLEFWINKYSKKEWLSIMYSHPQCQTSKYLFSFYQYVFEPANIKTFSDLYKFMKVFKNNSEYADMFKGNYQNLLETFGSLANFNDFSNYTEIFSECFDKSDKSNNSCAEQFKKYTDFLKSLNITREHDIPEKCKHLQAKFCEFETVSDKMDAIDYLMDTYPSKIDFLTKLNIYDKNNEEKTRQLYINNMDIIDYVYDANNGDLSELNNITEYLQNKDKFPKNTKTTICALYEKEDLTPADVLRFYKYLKVNNISVDDFNSLTKGTIISNNNVKDNILYFNSDISEIVALKGLDSFEKGKELYLRYPNCIRTINRNSNQNPDMLKNFFELTEKFNIRDGKELLRFYNKAYGTKENTIKSRQLYKFIENFQYLTTDDILNQAKKEKTTINTILTKEKKQFEQISDEISKFILEDTSDFYTGMCALDVYKKYKNEILKFPNVKAALSSISQHKTLDEYKKEQEINKFAEYIPDKKQLKQFILNNKISFEDNKLETEYRNCCLKILKLISNDANIQNKEDYIEYFINSEFLSQSKLLLPEFLNSQKSDEQKQKFLKLVSDKKIQNIPEFKTFLKGYADADGNYNNVIEHLSRTPDSMDYNSYMSFLENLKNKFSAYNIPINIDNSNVLNIKNWNTYVSDKENLTRINRLYNVPAGYNFVTCLSNSFLNYGRKITDLTVAGQLVEFYKPDDTHCGVNLLKLISAKHSDSLDLSNKIAVKNIIPESFVDFLNDDEYKKVKTPDGSIKIANITPHALLRLISRYVLEEGDTLDKLYTSEYKAKLNNLIQRIYSDKCLKVENGYDERFAITVKPECKAYFSIDGKLITVHD